MIYILIPIIICFAIVIFQIALLDIRITKLEDELKKSYRWSGWAMRKDGNVDIYPEEGGGGEIKLHNWIKCLIEKADLTRQPPAIMKRKVGELMEKAYNKGKAGKIVEGKK